jgi:hypothetical protein
VRVESEKMTEVAVCCDEVLCVVGEERETGEEERTRWKDGQKLV